MSIYRGIGVSEGIVMGDALTIYSAFLNYPRKRIESQDEIQHEIERIQKARSTTEKQINSIMETSNDFITDEIQSVFSGYKLFVNDKRFVPAIEENIKTQKINSEWALITVLADLKIQFSKIPDPYIRSRFDDIRQIGERLMNNLQQKPHFDLTNLKEPVILVSHDISPADAFHLDKTNILGIVTELGGATSHLAILARAMDIPAVVGVPNITARISDYETIILDGGAGEVINQPSQEIISEKLSKKERISFYQKELLELSTAECELADGDKVDIAANLDFLAELEQIQKLNIDSIGLIRTEFMFSYEDGFPDEDEQTEFYQNIIEKNQYKTDHTENLGYRR